jgi:hypothetical protein
MKKLLLLICITGLLHAAYAQVEKGDINLTFNVSYTSFSGTGFGLIAGKLGYFVTQNVEAGVTPQILIGDGFSAFGTGIYGTYNFLTADAKLLPYIGGAFSFLTGDTESTALGAYAGTKYFINEKVNIDGGINLSTNLGEEGGSIVIFQVGIGFILGKLN